MTKSKLLAVIVVIILATNIVLIFRIGDLQNQIQNLSHNYNNLQSSINSVTSNVNQTLDRFTREQSWITPIQTNNEKTRVEDEQGLLVLNWQIKDFQEGSEVNFHYRKSDTGEFSSISAESVNTGLFVVSLPVEIKSEPTWYINVSWSGESGVSQKVSRKTVDGVSRQHSLTYYVSMKTDGFIKSSEVSYLNYEYLANMKYQPIRGNVHIDDNNINITLHEEKMYKNAFESLTAEFYNNQGLIDEKVIEAQEDPNGMRHYHLWYDSGSEDISCIILEVKYENGDSFRKEVY